MYKDKCICTIYFLNEFGHFARRRIYFVNIKQINEYIEIVL